MKYMGGKSGLAKDLAKVIEGGSKLWEPFCGGGAMTVVLAPQFETVEASDAHEDLILMWQALCKGWEPPNNVTEDEYRALRMAEPSALRGFVGFACSWGGKWFGGYARGSQTSGAARNYADESSRSLLRDVEKAGNVNFSCKSYTDIKPGPGDVVYADPPYAGTTKYSRIFDSDQFWAVAESWASSGALVFVSEYVAPSGWPCVWEKTYTRNMKADAKTAVKVTDKLFFKGPW